jgi:4-azaleucine resistance transporter AzlC
MASVSSRSAFKNASLLSGGFLAGVRAALPLWLGITPYGLAFGLLGPTVGLGAHGTLAMSLLVFAGSAQFIALSLLGAGASYPLIVLTTLVVNLRHLLYGASLAPLMRSLTGRGQALASFLLTDETYAVAVDRGRREGTIEPAFYLGAGLVVYLDWTLSTAAGLALGGVIPDATALGLDFALPATFIGLLVPQLRSRGAWVALAVSAAVTLAAGGLPGRLGVLLATIAAATAGWGVEEWRSHS